MKDKIGILISQSDSISGARKSELQDLANIISKQIKEMGFSKLNFICTHNSRRSQLAQIWFWRALEYYDVKNISAYSGGTETTAFNHRMVAAVKRYGFNIIQLDESENPKYIVRSGIADEKEMLLFSKKYTHHFNTPSNYIAVMVCGNADEGCPFIPEAYSRFPLRYKDPKAADDTADEFRAYDDKVLEIGKEMLWLVGMLNLE